MRINHLQLIPATLLLFFSACQPTMEPKKNQASLPSVSYLDTEKFSPLEREAPTARESEVWDTSDVDISDVDPNHKLISFTFDDAPSKTLESILAVFAHFNEENPDYKASATVFCNSKLFDAQTPHLLSVACALGLELGNHTHAHADLTKLTDEEIRQEIQQTDNALKKIDGKELHLLRAPFGKVNERIKALSATPLIDWTIDTLDWTGVSAEHIFNEVFYSRFDGAIALMHDGYGHTVSALKRLLPALKAEGYQVVSLSKMIKANGCTFRRGGVYIRARKQK